MLDINLFRVDKGGNPEIVRESQRRRHASVELVDEVIAIDERFRALRGRVDLLNRYTNAVSKKVAEKKKAKEPDGEEETIPADITENLDEAIKDDARLRALCVLQLKALSRYISTEIARIQTEMETVEQERNKKLCLIGNIVHESVVVSNNEDENGIVRTWGEKREEAGLLNHVDLMTKIGGMDTITGAKVAGNRAYYLKGPLAMLHLAIINYATSYLIAKEYQPIYPPFFMTKDVMGEVAQLEQFDEELYKVTGEGDDKYLIATSEQPIAAYHRKQWLDEKDVPIRYAGYSSCFRKEVGSHGRDTLGIFRVHQFDKIEQFCVTSPKDNNSWEMMEEMIKNAEDFYKALGLPYRVVNIVSGALNNAAAKKLDLEAWFPASKTYRELVSCSNCTDYQARRLEVRYGKTKKGGAGEKDYVHMLNATLCAVTRVMCCIAENYQTPDGIKIPDVLIPYMHGITVIPFKN